MEGATPFLVVTARYLWLPCCRHLPKCFDNVHNLEFTEDAQVRSGCPWCLQLLLSMVSGWPSACPRLCLRTQNFSSSFILSLICRASPRRWQWACTLARASMYSLLRPASATARWRCVGHSRAHLQAPGLFCQQDPQMPATCPCFPHMNTHVICTCLLLLTNRHGCKAWWTQCVLRSATSSSPSFPLTTSGHAPSGSLRTACRIRWWYRGSSLPRRWAGVGLGAAK